MALTSVTRLPGGITNSPVDAALADLKTPNPLVYNYLHNDFNTFVAADWTVAGTAPGVPVAAAGDGGLVALPSTITNPSETSMTLPAATFVPDIGKGLFMQARMTIDNVAGGFLFGMAVATASPITVQPTNGIYIRKGPGAVSPVAILRVGGATVAQVTMDFPALMAAQLYDFAIAYTPEDGALRAFIGVNGVWSGYRLASNPTSLGATLLAPMFSVATALAAIRTLTIDSYYVAKAR